MDGGRAEKWRGFHWTTPSGEKWDESGWGGEGERRGGDSAEGKNGRDPESSQRVQLAGQARQPLMGSFSVSLCPWILSRF